MTSNSPFVAGQRVKCIWNQGAKQLTRGNNYIINEVSHTGNYFKVTDDSGTAVWHDSDRFEAV
jgi:hypothetical protein